MNLKAEAEKLQKGETTTFKSSGNSMTGKIDDKSMITIEPYDRTPKKGDIVLANVNGNLYVHLITAVRADGAFQISNNKGHVNGWTRKIFGRVVNVNGKEI